MGVEAPRPPRATDAEVLVWPMVEGRRALRDVGGEAALVIQAADDDWVGVGPGRWRLHSGASWEYQSVELAREVLGEFAQWHTAHAAVLSWPRCLAAGLTPEGKWRLWQLWQATPSVADEVKVAITTRRADAVGAALRGAAEALAAFAAHPLSQGLAGGPREVGRRPGGGPQLVGPAPRSPGKPLHDVVELTRAGLGPLLARGRASGAIDTAAVEALLAAPSEVPGAEALLLALRRELQ